MKIVSTIALTLISFVCLSQNLPVNKKQLSKIFESSIDQPDKKTVSVGTGAWTICNADSAYYKSDTIKLYSHINYFYQLNNCCNFVQWTFYTKDEFLENKSQICNEPASGEVATKGYKINIVEKNKLTFLYLMYNKKQLTKFQVITIATINLADGQVTKEVILKRV